MNCVMCQYNSCSESSDDGVVVEQGLAVESVSLAIITTTNL